jgi:hypothetical protein
LRDAIGIARQQRAAQRRVIDLLAIAAAEDTARDRRQLVNFGRRSAAELHGDRDRIVGAMRVDHDPREARMQRQRAKLLLRVTSMKRVELREAGVNAILRRPLEPGERPRIAAPRDDVEQRRREIDTAHIRLAMRTKHVARIPQPHRASGASASGAARALLRGIGRNPLDHEMIDRCFRIEAQYFVNAGVDDIRHAVDRQRRLGNVRRENHLAPIRRGERALLCVDVERAMQRQDQRLDV